MVTFTRLTNQVKIEFSNGDIHYVPCDSYLVAKAGKIHIQAKPAVVDEVARYVFNVTEINSRPSDVLEEVTDWLSNYFFSGIIAVSEEVAIAQGFYDGYTVITKFGRNPLISTGTTPEDVWNGGGLYTGFPTGAPEEFQVFSSNAGDTGVLTFTYLPTINATSYLTGTVTLQGTTPVNTGITGYRMHTANYASGTATTFNLGEITLRHRTTTANVFMIMPIGRSQSNMAAYTVPAGSTAIIKRLFCRVIGSTSGAVDGALWVRTNGGSPRLRRPFSATNGDRFEEIPYGGLIIQEKSDIIVRISTSTNNLDIIAGYDILLTPNM